MDLNQVTIGATNLDPVVAFYAKLGLRLIVLDEGRYARFELPSGSSTFSVHHDPEHVSGNTVIYFEVDDIDRVYAQLAESGIVFDSEPEDQSWRWREARLSDPAGNRLCLFHAGADRRFPPWRIED